MNMHPLSTGSNPSRLPRKPGVDSRHRTPLAKAILALATASGLMAGLPGQARAAVISYDYRTTLSYGFGAPDAEGLAGATVEFKFDVDADTRYVASEFGASASLNNDATVTISGASRSANNATFALGPFVFLPGTAGTFTPGGSNPGIALADGNYLSLNFMQAPTAHGSLAQIGDLIDVMDFAPTQSRLRNWTSAGTAYRQNDVIITASLPSTSADAPQNPAAIPEPASIALFGIGSVAAIGAVRRRRTA